MENTKKPESTAVATVPRISGSSPLAAGITVNISEVENPEAAGKPWRLRMWVAGSPVEDSYHETATDAAKRVGMIIVEGTVGAKLKNIALEGFAQLLRGGHIK